MSQVVEIDVKYVASKLEEWAAKSGKPVQELKDDFQRIFSTIEGKTEQIKLRKALRILKSGFESSMNSPAVSYKVIVFGKTGANDAVKKRRKDIMEKFKSNPSELITKGEVLQNKDGSLTLIDIRKEVNGKENYFYMKPIPDHSWLANCTAVAMKPGEDQTWLPANIVLRGDMALGDVPRFKEMEIRLNGQFSSQQGRYNLSSAKPTNFDTIVREVSSTEVVEIFDKIYGDNFVLAKDLESYHRDNASNQSRFVVTEGTVNGTYKGDERSILTLGDESLDLGETITCFVDASGAGMLDGLEEKDIVTVMGRSGTTKKYDWKKKERTDEEVVCLNLYGIFIRPE